jgi:hypothetical protein
MKELTKEQIKKIQVYGVCELCGAPRDMKVGEAKRPDGTLEVRSSMVCENGHKGW